MVTELVCDTCGSRIPETLSALVEWVLYGKGAARFKVIHDLKSSPRGREGCSFHALAGHDHLIQNMPADRFLEPDGLGDALADGVADAAALLDVLRRLTPDLTGHLLALYFSGRRALNDLARELLQLAREETVPYLVSRLGDPGDGGRRAGQVLAALGRPIAPALADVLASGGAPARCAAALALARMGDGALPAAAALTAALDDEEEEVRFKAAFALKVLGGMDYQEAADAVITALAPPMGPGDALEPFVDNSPLKRGVITAETSLTGEVVVDATGRCYLAPEEDDRGGGMGSVPLFGRRHGDQEPVTVTGVFDRDVGIWMAAPSARRGRS